MAKEPARDYELAICGSEDCTRKAERHGLSPALSDDVYEGARCLCCGTDERMGLRIWRGNTENDRKRRAGTPVKPLGGLPKKIRGERWGEQ